MIRKFLATGILAGPLLQLATVTPAFAINTTDYLIQMVCADNSTNIAQNGDPVDCPLGTTARKLMVGEALPYHKVDSGNYQYSDSFPINDANGISLGVQTFVFTEDIVTSADDKFNPAHGGYNIIGADSNYVFFRGTFDPSGGWQPWWTSNCDAKGWLLFPNTSAPLSYGGTASPTTNQPGCVTSTTNIAAATVEWNNYNVTYASTKTLDSLIVFAYAPSYGAIEVNYFTKEYGVTRWEAWKLGTGTTGDDIKDQCPNSLYSASLHGNNYYLFDCRDWSTLVQLSSPWDPTAVNSTTHEATWPVDPLYTSVNLLKNTYIGGAYAANGSPSCATTYWSRTSANVSWAWDTTPETPFHTAAGNCLLGFSSSMTGQAIFQTVSTGSGSSNFSYGTMLWSPSYRWVDEVVVPDTEVTSYYLLNDEVDWSTADWDPYPDYWAYDLTGTIRGMEYGGGPGPTGNESLFWVADGPPRIVSGYTIPAHYSLSSAPTADIKVVERNGSGVVMATKTMTVTLDAKPRVFSDTFTLNSATQTVTFSIEPKNNYVQYRFTGAWVARR